MSLDLETKRAFAPGGYLQEQGGEDQGKEEERGERGGRVGRRGGGVGERQPRREEKQHDEEEGGWVWGGGLESWGDLVSPAPLGR